MVGSEVSLSYIKTHAGPRHFGTLFFINHGILFSSQAHSYRILSNAYHLQSRSLSLSSSFPSDYEMQSSCDDLRYIVFIVSYASKLHTRFGNRIIVLDEKTSANVTTRRKPFDTTTSRNDITITKYPISSFGTSPLINRPTLISFSVSHSPVYSLISIRNPSSPNCACLYLCNS